MKALKFILSILYAIIVAYLLQRIFFWLIPIAMNISWGWFLVYLLLAGGFVSIGIGALCTFLAIPNGLLISDNKVAKAIAALIYGLAGISTVVLPWANGVSSFGVLRWIIAISLSVLILLTFVGFIGTMYNKEGEDTIVKESNIVNGIPFEVLFNSFLDGSLVPSAENVTLREIIVKQPKEWEHYCMSRKNEYRPKYQIGMLVSALNEDTNDIEKGMVCGVEFNVTWWYYKVVFENEISIYNSWVRKDHLLSDDQIYNLINRLETCSDCHYVY